MLKAANTDLFPKAHNCECQNLLYPLQNKQVKVNLKFFWQIFTFFTFGTNGLS